MNENAVHQSDPDGRSLRSPSAIRSYSLSYRISRSPRSLNFPTGIQDRRPRHSEHPSPPVMRVVFSVFLVQTWAGSQNLLQSVAKPQGHGSLPWKPVTLSAISLRLDNVQGVPQRNNKVEMNEMNGVL